MIRMAIQASRSNDPKRVERWLGSNQAAARVKVEDRVIASARERCVRVQATLLNSEPVFGSGVIIQTGLVVTNYHVVEKAPDNITVNDHPAQIVDLPFRFSFCNDLVALVTKTRRLRMVSFNESTRQADPVFYVGNPEDWTKTISKGIVTKIDRRGQRIYSSTLTGEGVSGSGLYNQSNGALVGIIDSIDGSRGSSGCNFTICVPAQNVMALVKEALVYLRRQQNFAKPVRQVRSEEPNLSLDFDQDQEGRKYE